MSHAPGIRWLARRLGLGVLVVLGAATVAFVAFHLVPGDPVRVLLGAETPTPDQLAEVRGRLGYDRPILVQYGSFLKALLDRKSVV